MLPVIIKTCFLPPCPCLTHSSFTHRAQTLTQTQTQMRRKETFPRYESCSFSPTATPRKSRSQQGQQVLGQPRRAAKSDPSLTQWMK